LAVCRKTKHFLFYIFFWCLDENRVFSYRTCIFIVQKYNLAENHRFFKYIFEENFLNGPDPAKRKMGRNQPKNKMGLLYTEPSPNHTTGYCSLHSNTLINFPVTVHMHSTRVIIILTLTKQTACKRPRYCSSELNFTWTVQTQSKKLHSAGGYSSIQAGGLLFKWINSLEHANTKKTNARKGWREHLETKKLSAFVCFKSFPPVLYWRLFSCFCFPLRLSLSALSSSLFCRCYM